MSQIWWLNSSCYDTCNAIRQKTECLRQESLRLFFKYAISVLKFMDWLRGSTQENNEKDKLTPISGKSNLDHNMESMPLSYVKTYGFLRCRNTHGNYIWEHLIILIQTSISMWASFSSCIHLWLDSLNLMRFKGATSSLYTNCKITNNQIMWLFTFCQSYRSAGWGSQYLVRSLIYLGLYSIHKHYM